MVSEKTVDEGVEGESPDSESAPVDRFGRQISDVQDMPTEPGLYWAQTSLVDGFDSIFEVYGKAPFMGYRYSA